MRTPTETSKHNCHVQRNWNLLNRLSHDSSIRTRQQVERPLSYIPLNRSKYAKHRIQPMSSGTTFKNQDDRLGTGSGGTSGWQECFRGQWTQVERIFFAMSFHLEMRIHA